MKQALLIVGLMVVAWLLGFVAGYFQADIERRHAKRLSYVDRTPPPCLFKATRDQRHVCEWARVEQPK